MCGAPTHCLVMPYFSRPPRCFQTVQIYFSLFYRFKYRPMILMRLAYRLSPDWRQIFCSVMLNLLNFVFVHNSHVLEKEKNMFSFIFVYSSPFLNIALWLFSHLDNLSKQYITFDSFLSNSCLSLLYPLLTSLSSSPLFTSIPYPPAASPSSSVRYSLVLCLAASS